MKNYIKLSKVEGAASRQAHTDLPEGTYEREMSKEGFFGPSAQLYHKRPPTGWSDWEGPLRPRALDLNKLAGAVASPWAAQMVLFNAHCKVRMWRAEGAMRHLARNGDGDELLFIHDGQGQIFTDFGRMDLRAGDYIMLPRGTVWRTEFEGAADVLMIEATNESYHLPDKGMVGHHALFDAAMLESPTIDEAYVAQQTPEGKQEEWKIEIKRRDALSVVTYDYNPLDTVGWHGDLMPVKINVEHFRPLMSHRYHLPPSAHTTFMSPRFVICTFCPRPMESDPGALKVPFFHNNDDYDEVLFYHRGDFFSRDNIDRGMITFHPCGFTHGPHPKALQGMLKPKRLETDEYAVMIDTRDALEVAELPAGVENEDYVNSWKPKAEAAE
ncbi:MAG: homogentisate 1,2-dioxygenase [Rhodospirillaceae bacterium]|jgi:homogentisate 1,2-dioxygenase|nr:homogentisate 1,2-dioxygenase [Rhodospirillaceae bacterium]MBT6139151.1 homogentisate 1,2-dioxygenase [Rhodospirillaceae bacterium]